MLSARLISRARVSSNLCYSAVASTTVARAARLASTWQNVPQGPPDAILGITEAFKADKAPHKINLGVGAYRTGEGKPYVLNVVRTAEKRVVDRNLDKEYAGITGLPVLSKCAAELAYGAESKPLKEGRVALTQTISGTGALRVGAEFLAKFLPSKTIMLPTPTWANHKAVFTVAGMTVKQYRYYDSKHIKLDIEGLKADLASAAPGTAVLLHACAHNPTGVDPTPEQWQEIYAVMKERQLFPVFDMAYQGFASGDFARDAYAVRLFVDNGMPIALNQSFAKNMGLYGERVGAFSLVCASPEEKARVESQLKIVIRPLYSNPPIHGARIASEIMTDEELRANWFVEVKEMADRIIAMRQLLREKLEKLGSKKDWSHITSQIGMFCFTGLSGEQVDRLAKEFSVYCTRDGRISISGITPGNVDHLAKAIFAVAG